jgi:CHAT domain-containing protein
MEFGAERLRACDVLSAHFERAPVIVLAACRTSDDTVGRSSISLTTAFVAAGASAVVGTLWDVEDEGTAELLSEFHRSLSRGAKPWDALRTAQVEAIRKGKNADLWAAFQLQI